AFVTILDEMRQVRQEILRQSEQNLVALAMKLAEKIVCREVSTEEGIVLDVAREVLSAVSGIDRIEIVLHPQDHEFLETSRDNLMERVEGINAVELKQDAEVGRGGCIINTALGRLDSRIEKRMERLFRSVEEKMADRTDPRRYRDD
ncbi:MAG: FliH/SctL family protein, partial [bacterium]|nr:FliH/SctL family protein [bacterium]